MSINSHFYRLGAAALSAGGAILLGKCYASNRTPSPTHTSPPSQNSQKIQQIVDELHLLAVDGFRSHDHQNLKNLDVNHLNHRNQEDLLLNIDCLGAGIFHDDLTVTGHCMHLKQALKQILDKKV